MCRFDPGVLVTPVNKFRRLEREVRILLHSEDPCRLARQVNQFRTGDVRQRSKLLHPLDKPTGVGG